MTARAKIEKSLYDQILESMPIICVDLVIMQGGKALLVKRKKSPALNQWWFPGGRIFKGETIQDSAIRKATEELGLHCGFARILGIEETYFAKEHDMKFDVHTINVVVELEAKIGMEIILDDDHSDHMWTDHISEVFHPSVQNTLKKMGLNMNGMKRMENGIKPKLDNA